MNIPEFLKEKNVYTFFGENQYVKKEDWSKEFDESKHLVRQVSPNEIILEIDFDKEDKINFEKNKAEAYRIQGLNYKSFEKEGFNVYFFDHRGRSPYLRLYNINYLEGQDKSLQFDSFVKKYCIPLPEGLTYDKSFYSTSHWSPIEGQKHQYYDTKHELINFLKGDNSKIKLEVESPNLMADYNVKVKESAWEILQMDKPNEIQRVACVMKIMNNKKFETQDELFNYISKNCKWINFNEKITRDKINYVWAYTLKENPNMRLIEDDIVTGVFQIEDYRNLFENSHSHFRMFEELENQLGLQGKEYYALKKAEMYFVESLRQPTVNSYCGKYKMDNRFNFVAMIDAGFGKGELKAIPKSYINSVEINGARTHIEQLIGKYIQVSKKSPPKEIKGYFDQKCIIADECQTLVKEENPALSSLMAEFRKALDIWNKNKVQKKLVGDAAALEYYPESRVMFLMHKTTLPALFFDYGTSRRFFTFEINLKKLTKKDSQRDYDISIAKEDELEQYINLEAMGVEEIRYDEEGKELFKEWVYNFQRFGLNHSNPKIRTLMFLTFFSINTYFFKCVNILACHRRQPVPSTDTINRACFDCVQFLLETFKCYVENSTVDLSRVIWVVDEEDDAWLLQWMYYNGATSKENSPLTISDVQDKICNLRGINERMGRRVYSKLKTKGIIYDAKSNHTSKCWTNIQPKIDGSIDVLDFPPIDFMEYLQSKKKELSEVN